MIKKPQVQPLVWWAYGALVVTGVLFTAYALVQQNYRTGLDAPQAQLAEDAATAIAGGTQIDQVIPTGKVDVAKSLAPWLAFYNNAGVPLQSQGELNGAPPVLPAGLLQSSTWSNTKTYTSLAGYKETRVTWQAPDGTRSALVVVQVNSPNGTGYVVAGRNMRDVEQYIEHEGEMVFAGWLLTLAVLLGAVYLYQWLLRTI